MVMLLRYLSAMSERILMSIRSDPVYTAGWVEGMTKVRCVVVPLCCFTDSPAGARLFWMGKKLQCRCLA